MRKGRKEGWTDRRTTGDGEIFNSLLIKANFLWLSLPGNPLGGFSSDGGGGDGGGGGCSGGGGGGGTNLRFPIPCCVCRCRSDLNLFTFVPFLRRASCAAL